MEVAFTGYFFFLAKALIRMKREQSETVGFVFCDQHIVCFHRQSPLSVCYKVSSCCRSFVSWVWEESTDVLYRCIHLAVLTGLGWVTSLPLITILRVVPGSVRACVRMCVTGFSIPPHCFNAPFRKHTKKKLCTNANHRGHSLQCTNATALQC